MLAVLLFAPALCLAQTAAEPEPPPASQPPLVPAPVDTATPRTDVELQPTPPPPGATPSPPGAQPLPGSQPTTGYPYSPYGTPYPNLRPEPPPVEVGLMVSEGGFGMLTAAAVTVIPYYLFLKNLMLSSGDGIDPTAKTVIFILLLATVPLSVSQTELSIANGSRFYTSDSWPASLSGLGAEAAVFGLYALLGGINGGGTSEAVLIIGSSVFVPLVELAVINLTKMPRGQGVARNFGAVMSYEPGRGLSAHLPIVAPLAGPTRLGRSAGLSVPLVAGRF